MSIYHQTTLRRQQGIGLIEVMVALMLLAVAVLGFTAMQMTAVKASDESLMRTRALTIMRGGAEMMRANPTGIGAFKTAINATATSAASTVGAISSGSCVLTACPIADLATRDAIAVTNQAKRNGLQIAMVTCPGTANVAGTAATSTTSAVAATYAQERQCFIASWGSTLPSLGAATNDCANTDGIYKPGAQCFILETY